MSEKITVTRYIHHVVNGKPVQSAVTAEFEQFPESCTQERRADINRRNAAALREAVESRYPGMRLLILNRDGGNEEKFGALLEHNLILGSGVTVSGAYARDWAKAENDIEKYGGIRTPSTAYYNYLYAVGLSGFSLQSEEKKTVLEEALSYDGFADIYGVKADTPSPAEALNVYRRLRGTGFMDRLEDAGIGETGASGIEENFPLFEMYRAEAAKEYYLPRFKDGLRKKLFSVYREAAEGRISEEEFMAAVETCRTVYVRRGELFGIALNPEDIYSASRKAEREGRDNTAGRVSAEPEREGRSELRDFFGFDSVVKPDEGERGGRIPRGNMRSREDSEGDSAGGSISAAASEPSVPAAAEEVISYRETAAAEGSRTVGEVSVEEKEKLNIPGSAELPPELIRVLTEISEMEVSAKDLESTPATNAEAEAVYENRCTYSEAFTEEKLSELVSRIRINGSIDFEAQVAEAHEVFKRDREVRELLYRAGNFDKAEQILREAGAGDGAKAFLELGRRNIEQIPSAHQMAAIHNLEKGETRAVVAVPGSGKTSSLIFIMENAIAEGKVKPDEITAISYTTAAAGELSGRMERRNPDLAGAGIKISTAHALARSIIKTYSPDISLRVLKEGEESERFYDEVISKTITSLAKEEHDRTGKSDNEMFMTIEQSMRNGQIERALQVIRVAPWSRKQLEKASASTGIKEECLKKAYEVYMAEKKKWKVIDFEDMLLKAVQILMTDKRARKEVQSRAKLLIVDEYQDTSQLQYLFEAMIRPDDGIKVVVGDDDQSIFASLDADNRLLKNYAVGHLASRMKGALVSMGLLEGERYPGERKRGYYIIPKNYRSDRSITAVGNDQGRFIPDRIPKSIQPSERAGDGTPPEWHNVQSKEDEYRFACEKIRSGIASGRAPEEYAVMVRWRSEAAEFRKYVSQHYPELAEKIAVMGKNPMVEEFTGNRKAEAELRPILESLSRPGSGYLFNRLLQNCGLYSVCHVNNEAADPIGDFERNAKAAGIRTAEVMSFISAYREALKEDMASEAVCAFLTERENALTGRRVFSYGTHQLKWLDVLTAKNVTREGGIDFCAMMEEEAGKSSTVVRPGFGVITYHKSKGREFETVFMTGLEDTNLDKQTEKIENNGVKREQEAETERILYVGYTRAKKECYMLSCGFSKYLNHLSRKHIRYFVNGVEMEAAKDGLEALKPVRIRPRAAAGAENIIVKGPVRTDSQNAAAISEEARKQYGITHNW